MDRIRLQDYTVYLCQLLLSEFNILYRPDIIEHLSRSGGSDEHTCHDSVTEHPAQCHLGKRLSSSRRNPVEIADLLEAFLRECLFFENGSDTSEAGE